MCVRRIRLKQRRMLQKIIISTSNVVRLLLHSRLFSKRKCQHTEKIFLVLEFLLGKYNKVEFSQKYLFLFRVDHCPQFLFALVAAKITFFVSHPLLVFSNFFDQDVGGKTKQKIIDMYLLRPIVSTKKT